MRYNPSDIAKMISEDIDTRLPILCENSEDLVVDYSVDNILWPPDSKYQGYSYEVVFDVHMRMGDGGRYEVSQVKPKEVFYHQKPDLPMVTADEEWPEIPEAKTSKFKKWPEEFGNHAIETFYLGGHDRWAIYKATDGKQNG